MSASNFVDRYTVADLFDRTFAMIRRTWRTSLGIGATVFLIPSVLIGWATVRSIGSIGRLVEQAGPNAGPEIIWPALRGIGLMPLAGVIVGIAYLFAQLVVTDAVRAEALQGEHSLNASVQKTLRKTLLPVIGQVIIKGVVFGLLIAVPLTVLVVAIAVAEASTFFVVFGVLFYLAALGVSLRLWIALLFAQHAVVFDGAEIMAGLRESMRLVRRNWWRILGLYLLVQIVLSFLVGLVSTPIVGASVLPSIGRFIDLASAEPISDAQVARVLSSLSGLGVGVVIAALIQQLLTLLIVPVAHALLYVDLKVRHGDLPAASHDGRARTHEPPDDGTAR